MFHGGSIAISVLGFYTRECHALVPSITLRWLPACATYRTVISALSLTRFEGGKDISMSKPRVVCANGAHKESYRLP